MEYLIALLVGLGVAIAAYHAWPLPAGYFAGRAREAYDESTTAPLPFHRALLANLTPLAKYTPVGWAKTIARQLYWAQMAGRWADWTLPELITLIAALGIACPFVLNILTLRAPARRVHRQIQAELPELVTLLAAEVAAGTTLLEAFHRLSRGSSLGAIWIRRVVTAAVGDTLFSRAGQEGAMLLEARASGDDGLVALAINLDKISVRGTGARELLAQTARSTAAHYVAGANLRAEKVGSEIILPMIFFFFLPYVAIILMVLSAPLLGGGLIG
jgi:hypothetical protein